MTAEQQAANALPEPTTPERTHNARLSIHLRDDGLLVFFMSVARTADQDGDAAMVAEHETKLDRLLEDLRDLSIAEALLRYPDNVRDQSHLTPEQRERWKANAAEAQKARALPAQAPR